MGFLSRFLALGLIFLSSCNPAFSQGLTGTGSGLGTAPLRVKDGTSACSPAILNFPAGSLTCSGGSATVSGGGTPANPSGSVQYNNAGAFGPVIGTYNGTNQLGWLDNITVSAGGTPDVSGTYKFTGKLYTFPYFSNGTAYLFFNAVKGTYVISTVLADSANYYQDNTGALAPGTFVNHGAYAGTVTTSYTAGTGDTDLQGNFYFGNKMQINSAGFIGDNHGNWGINSGGSGQYYFTTGTVATLNIDQILANPANSLIIGSTGANFFWEFGYASYDFINGANHWEGFSVNPFGTTIGKLERKNFVSGFTEERWDNGSWTACNGTSLTILCDEFTPANNALYIDPDLNVNIISSDNKLNQSAALGSTSLGTPFKTGLYEICYEANVTQAASVTSTLGGSNGFQVSYPSADDFVTKTSPQKILISAGNTTATQISGCTDAFVAGATSAITYTFDYSSTGGTPMLYNIHVRVRYMSN